jgi:hypothetical protein
MCEIFMINLRVSMIFSYESFFCSVIGFWIARHLHACLISGCNLQTSYSEVLMA